MDLKPNHTYKTNHMTSTPQMAWVFCYVCKLIRFNGWPAGSSNCCARRSCECHMWSVCGVTAHHPICAQPPTYHPPTQCSPVHPTLARLAFHSRAVQFNCECEHFSEHLLFGFAPSCASITSYLNVSVTLCEHFLPFKQSERLHTHYCTRSLALAADYVSVGVCFGEFYTHSNTHTRRNGYVNLCGCERGNAAGMPAERSACPDFPAGKGTLTPLLCARSGGGWGWVGVGSGWPGGGILSVSQPARCQCGKLYIASQTAM